MILVFDLIIQVSLKFDWNSASNSMSYALGEL